MIVAILGLGIVAVPVGAQEPSTPSSSVCQLPQEERPDPVEPLELCGVTTIRGSQPAAVDIVLPREATVATPFESSPDLDVEGEGRFVGFVLTGVGPGTSGLTLVGGRYPDRESPYEFLMPVPPYPAPGGGSFEVLKLYGNETTLPAGDYRLYLLTDGSEAEVTLRLDELEGWVDLAPQRPADYGLFFPEPRVLGGAGLTNNVYGAGRSDTLAETGLAFQALWLDTDVHAAGQYELCYRPPTDDDIDPIEFGPGCGGFSEKREFVNNRSPTTERDTKLYMQGLDQLDPGRQHLGFWSVTEAVVTDLRYMQFWLSYGDPPPVTEDPHVADGCGDADRMLQVGGTVVGTPDPERAASFDVDAAWFEDLYDEAGEPASVRITLRMCGDVPEPDLVGSGWAVRWNIDGPCSRTVILNDSDGDDPSQLVERGASLVSQCSEPGPIPGSSQGYVEWEEPLDAESYTVDGNVITWTLSAEDLPPERAEGLAPGTVWTSPSAYARDGRQLTHTESWEPAHVYASGPGGWDTAPRGRDFTVDGGSS